MYNYNVFIPGSGWGVGANIDLYEEKPESTYPFGGLMSFVMSPLIYNWEAKTVHPRNSSEVIGVINRFFYVPAPSGYPTRIVEDSSYNFDTILDDAANGQVILEEYQINYIKKLNGE